MQTVPLDDMDGETERLVALAGYDILDTPAEPGFDDIVFIASQSCEAPVALVSLLDRDRQWFKARVGFERCETPIGQSVCAHALAGQDLLVIPDLTLDRRTRDNPLVTHDPHLRFYAGAPLVTPDGVAIGTLCVIDMHPRPDGLTEVQTRVLLGLSRQVISQMELRRLVRIRDAAVARERRSRMSSVARTVATEKENALLRASKAHSRVAEEAGRIGTFEVDVASGISTVSPEFCRLAGLPVLPTVAASVIDALVLPDDAAVRSDPRTRQDGSAAPEVEYRIRRADDGQLRWIARRAAFLRDDGGQVSRMVGTIYDVTERRTLQEQQAALLELGDLLRGLGDASQMADAAAKVMVRILGATRAGYGRVDHDRGHVVLAPGWSKPGVASVIGLHHSGDHGSLMPDLARGEIVVIPDIASDPRTHEAVGALQGMGVRALINVPLIEHEVLVAVLFVHDETARPWTESDVGFVRAVADRTQAAIARMLAEKQQRLVNQELSHRLKNTFAMIQAIAAQTLRKVTERDRVQEFEQRIYALSSAHDVLVKQNWAAADIREVVASALATFGQSERFDTGGPEIELHSRATLSLSLILHELATNASKYGALSVENGTVSLHWQIDHGPDGVPGMVLSWVERGGPPVREPDRKGFGSRLIGMGLVGTGGVKLRYDNAGLHVEMRAPINQICDPAKTGDGR